MLSRLEINQRLEDTLALTTGHLRLPSGLHTRTSLDRSRLYLFPAILEELVACLIEPFVNSGIETIVALTKADMTLALKAAKNLGLPADAAMHLLTADKQINVPAGCHSRLRSRRVLTVKAVVRPQDTTNIIALRAVREAGAEVVGLAAILTSDGTNAHMLGVPLLRSLLELRLTSWCPRECPLCRGPFPASQVIQRVG